MKICKGGIMWISNTKQHLLVIAGCLIAFSAFNFMSEEYYTWKSSMACNEKCEVLGCKTGNLIFGQENQTVACRCESSQDYLVILN